MITTAAAMITIAAPMNHQALMSTDTSQTRRPPRIHLVNVHGLIGYRPLHHHDGRKLMDGPKRHMLFCVRRGIEVFEIAAGFLIHQHEHLASISRRQFKVHIHVIAGGFHAAFRREAEHRNGIRCAQNVIIFLNLHHGRIIAPAGENFGIQQIIRLIAERTQKSLKACFISLHFTVHPFPVCRHNPAAAREACLQAYAASLRSSRPPRCRSTG
mgnify:CR=1 FL=1